MTPTYIAATGIVITSGATVAVVQGVETFTAFAAMGAAAGVFYSFLSHDAKEPKRAVNARVLLGMIGGVVGPRLAERFSVQLQAYTIDPIIIIGMGFVAAWFCYFILHLMFRKLDHRAAKIADLAVRAAEAKAGLAVHIAKEPEGEE